MDTAPNSHKFKLHRYYQITDQGRVKEEIKLLKSSLPPGIWVTAFEDRMDLFSVMIRGPEKTPYEDGLFCFDLQLSPNYPRTPPKCHYISYCTERLNPNLYVNGTVCVSLLGTWPSANPTENWNLTSNLLQVIVSIQGLILVAEPFFNEPGFEKLKGSFQGREMSRNYNEKVIVNVAHSTTKLIASPPEVFKDEIAVHFRDHAKTFCDRLESWLDVSAKYNACDPISQVAYWEVISAAEPTQDHNGALPDFPLLPASRDFCSSLQNTLIAFKQALPTI